MIKDTSALYVDILLDTLSKLGLSKKIFLEQYDITRPSHIHAFLPLTKVVSYWQHAEDYSNDHFIGFEAGKRISHNDTSLLIYAAMSSKNLGQGLEILSQYRYLISRKLKLEFSNDNNGNTTCSLNFEGITNEEARQLVELSLTIVFSFAHFILGKDLRKKFALKEVHFRHSEKNPIKPYENHFICPVKFNQDTSKLVFSTDLLTLKLPNQNSYLRKTLTDMLDSKLKTDDRKFEKVINDRVKLFIKENLGDKLPNASECAKHFAMSRSTFTRQLTSEGFCYSELLNEIQKVEAKRLLTHSERSIEDISYHLGFTYTSSFNRFFKRWYHSTPREYREKNENANATFL